MRSFTFGRCYRLAVVAFGGGGLVESGDVDGSSNWGMVL